MSVGDTDAKVRRYQHRAAGRPPAVLSSLTLPTTSAVVALLCFTFEKYVDSFEVFVVLVLTVILHRKVSHKTSFIFSPFYQMKICWTIDNFWQ